MKHSKAVLDWILLFLLQPVTFSLRLYALSLIEVQKPEEEIELQIELYPKVIWASERYTTATELLAYGHCRFTPLESNYKTRWGRCDYFQVFVAVLLTVCYLNAELEWYFSKLHALSQCTVKHNATLCNLW